MASNYGEVLDQLRSAGLQVDSVDTGRMVRCKVEGDREKRGWYSLHDLVTQTGETMIVGSFGVWQGNSNNAQKIELKKSDFSQEQRESLRRRMAEDRKRADALRKAEGKKAAQVAATTWKKCSESGESEYLTRKAVMGYGVRYSPSGALVIPVADAAGMIQGLQIIRSKAKAKADRRPEKEFWPTGMMKKGHFHLIGMPDGVVLMAEGYATAATLHAATGLPVAVAWDAGNLGPVAIALRARYKSAKILICADDDAFGDTNAGVIAASAAAMEVGGAFVVPVFEDEADRQAKFATRSIKLTDFNDLQHAESSGKVRDQIHACISELGWSNTRKPAPSQSTQGGGGNAPLKPIESLDELLERYALVYGQKGTVFDRSEHCLLALSDMRDACIARELHRGWSEHPDRAIVRVREVGFDPSEDDANITCNLWGGWPTTPVPGKCEKLLDLLRYMCSADSDPERLYQWVLRWIAYPIQHPGAKMKTTLVLHGPQGTGKNLFFETIMSIYGQYGRIIDQTAIEDRFNDWASRKLFLIADEVVARSDLFHVKNRLKAFITGDWIRINPKNMAAYDERNHVNLVFLSNEAMPVVLEEDDRRHCVIWTPDKMEPGAYAGIMAEIAGGGVAAMHDYLLHLDMGEFNPGTLPPNNDAKKQLVDLGLDSPSRFFYALINGDIIPLPELKDHQTDADRVWPRAGLSQDVFELYRNWCARVGAYARPMPQLINALSRKHKTPAVRSHWTDDNDPVNPRKGPHGILEFFGGVPPGEAKGDWYGREIAKFRVALKDYKGASNA